MKDIILPKKRDVNGKRYGFIITYDLPFAIHLTQTCNGEYLMRNKLLLKLNTTERSMSQDRQLPYPPPPVQKPNPSMKSTEELVKQPSHRTIMINLEASSAQVMERSIIGITQEDQWADILQEKYQCILRWPSS